MFFLRFTTTTFLGLLAVSLAVFIATENLSGDAATIQLGIGAQADTLAALQRTMGLDQPPLHRYLAWLGGILQGRLGVSLHTGVPVGDILAPRLLLTAVIVFSGLLIALIIGGLAGLVAGWFAATRIDTLLMTISQVIFAIPSFCLGLALILLFSVTLRWLPAGGFAGWQAGWVEVLRALCLPALALGLAQAAVFARVTRAATIDTLKTPYIRTAAAKGLSPLQILRYHVIQALLMPVFAVTSVQIGLLITGAVIVETVFSLPGLGQIFVQSVFTQDMPVIRTIALLTAAVMMCTTQGLAALQRFTDPRA